ncbi:MAG: YceI family protein [Balneolaceae bacterium]|nr:YceI family protein [Balneolaceae bacterium]
MKKVITSILSLTVALAFSISGVWAQSESVSLLSESTMTVVGTSTLHDWEVDVQTMNLDAEFTDAVFTEDLPTSADFVESLKLTVPVKSLESGKGGMNNKMYDAFNAKKNPNIVYEFSSAQLDNSAAGEGFTLNTTGQLTMNGVTRSVNFPVQGTVSGENQVNFTGSYTMKMTDFKNGSPQRCIRYH